MDEEISRAEHEEFARRVDEHLHREDARLEAIEQDVKDLKAQNATLERLATNMQSMCAEQKKQGQRLERLENRDGEKWRQAVGYACTAVISIIAGVLIACITAGL